MRIKRNHPSLPGDFYVDTSKDFAFCSLEVCSETDDWMLSKNNFTEHDVKFGIILSAQDMSLLTLKHPSVQTVFILTKDRILWMHKSC